ncbi:30S ribosomal protein S21 [Candidatus Mesenet endosymbiont of Agriotes lineatus]|uniref:30S ribosomal protein S21 n=1 Tax=Candidatus Mesenet endosymbiont of Agriotes lineatus TaxID=3077948 RepID=UPI0030D04C59
MQEKVQHGNLDQALRILKRKLQREGVLKKMKIRHHEKGSEKRKRKKAELERRARKSEL